MTPADPRDGLLPCPFCGADAEMDTTQAFLALQDGRLESSVAIYCTKCVVQMQHCYSDHPGIDRESLWSDLTERWNTRIAHARPEAVNEAMARRLDDYLGGEFDIRIGKQAAHAALTAALTPDQSP